MGGLKKVPSEGGSGGKRGHSSMEHSGYSDEVKAAARTVRRRADRGEVTQQLRDAVESDDPLPVPDRRDRPEAQIVPGTIYEDCGYNPVLCTHASIDDDELTGISLMDGQLRSCSMFHCGAEVLSLAQVLVIRKDFEGYVLSRQSGGPLPIEDP